MEIFSSPYFFTLMPLPVIVFTILVFLIYVLDNKVNDKDLMIDYLNKQKTNLLVANQSLTDDVRKVKKQIDDYRATNVAYGTRIKELAAKVMETMVRYNLTDNNIGDWWSLSDTILIKWRRVQGNRRYVSQDNDGSIYLHRRKPRYCIKTGTFITTGNRVFLFKCKTFLPNRVMGYRELEAFYEAAKSHSQK